MDGAGATAAPPLGAWASIRGYFTPATLFLVVNLVIGTIALTSRSNQRRRRGYHQDDAHHQEPLHQLSQQEYHYYQQPQQQYAPPPAPLARTSSVLDRLRSLGLYRFRSGDFPPEYTAAAASHAQDVISPVDDETKQTDHYARSRSEPAPAREEKREASRMKKSSSEVRKAEVARAPARVVQAAVEEDVVDARADQFIDNFGPQQQELDCQEEYVPPPAPAPLARAPSVLERLRSFGLYRFRSGDLAPEYAAPTPAPYATTAAADKKKQAAHYDRSRSEPTREQNKKEKKQAPAEARMTKSSSEARKAAEAAPSIVEECVDARADDFINKFRQQLQLQRLNSLLNYKEMLNRGGKQ